ncbi:MAG: hypothetical protein CMJ46_16530 [Planctomyces sp.]|nr:hypothetical protein [Planctomyces sp.]
MTELFELAQTGLTILFERRADTFLKRFDVAQLRLAALSLDHDLISPEGNESKESDPGDGRDVTRRLRMYPPVCPVLIHSTNKPAAATMKQDLKDGGWKTRSVVPYGDLDWIPELWLPTILRMIASATN